jgi:hypothetical protein
LHAALHLARLSINQSRFRIVRAQGLRLVGSLGFAGARPFETSDSGALEPAFIDAGGARIGGDVEGARATLRAPLSRSNPDITQFALRLAVCEIGGRISLDGAEFHGGLSLADSDIRGTVWLSGVHTTAGDGEALLGRGARLRSTLSMGNIGSRPFVAEGEVSLVGANIAGRLICKNAKFNSRMIGATSDAGRDDAVAFRGDNAHVGGHALFTGVHADGILSLAGAIIDGDLDCTDANLNAGARWTSLNATNIEVRGGLYLRKVVSAGRLAFWNGKIGHGFHADGAKLIGRKGVAIDAANLQINGDLNLRRRDGDALEITGRANFGRCDVSRNVNLDGLVMSPAPNDDAASDCGGSAELVLNHARVGAQLVTHDLTAAGKLMIDLRGASTSMLSDNWPKGWGGRAAIADGRVRLVLDGFSYVSVESPSEGGIRAWVDDRLSWLTLERSSAGAFSPYSYRHLARALREQGHDNEARRVAVREHWRTPAPAWYRFTLKPLYGVFFGFGLAPGNALATLLGMLAIGTAGTAYAQFCRQMVVSTTPIVLNVTGTARPRQPPPTPLQVTSIGVANTVCSDQIEPLFYAVDLMLPVVPLHQETKCDIADGPAHAPWRWAKFIYSVLGKLVTTLAFITFSGVVRNREQS